jgi:glucose/mannose-6-phosphate isomerase
LITLRDAIGFNQPYAKNPAKQLAIQLMGTFPFVYSSQFLSVAGRRFKNQLNENSKVIAKHESTPEMLHNEVQSWYMLKEATFARSVSFVLLRGCETKDEATRFDRLATIIRDQGGTSVHEVSLGIASRLPAILATIYYCDFVSYYLAVARGVDPTPIETIWTLKRSTASQAT